MRRDALRGLSLEDRGPQALKGVREPVPLYRVVQPSGVRSRLDVAAGRLSRFVGREVELATLVDRWERTADGEGQNVVVLGEAGVGKSRPSSTSCTSTWRRCRAFAPEDTAAEKLRKLEVGLRTLRVAFAHPRYFLPRS